jgi:hypothetical protein
MSRSSSISAGSVAKIGSAPNRGISAQSFGSWESYWTPRYTTEQIQALIDDGFIPIASGTELAQIYDTSTIGGTTKTWGVGTIWERTVVTTSRTQRLTLKYVQVADIDLYALTRLGGAQYNYGAGWVAISTFIGTYDGGGYIISGMYINTTVIYSGLFGAIRYGAVLRNIACLNAEVISTANYCGILVGDIREAPLSYITQCITSGTIVHSGATYCGGIIGGRHTATCFVNIERCVSSAIIYSTGDRVGGIIGMLSTHASFIKDSLFIGYISNPNVAGAIAGFSEAIAGGDGYPDLLYNYYNSEASGLEVATAKPVSTLG